MARRPAASSPAEKKDSEVKCSIMLLLRCARRTAYLLLVFGPLLLLYPLSRWKVRSLRFAQSPALPSPFLGLPALTRLLYYTLRLT